MLSHHSFLFKETLVSGKRRAFPGVVGCSAEVAESLPVATRIGLVHEATILCALFGGTPLGLLPLGLTLLLQAQILDLRRNGEDGDEAEYAKIGRASCRERVSSPV